MDIVVVIFSLVMILIGIVIFSILPILTFLLYRHLKKKNNDSKKIGLTIFILTTIGMISIVLKIIFGPSGFGPEYDSALIKQKIGGNLLCDSEYNADLHSWVYEIDYKYINIEGDTIEFSNGFYRGREWNKDEQISKFDKYLILKTGSWEGSDKLIIKNIQTDSTKTFDIDANFIEKDSLWKTKKIKSLLNYCCAETFIESIKSNKIILKYKFRTNESLTNKYGERKVTYMIEKETGDIKMTNINE